MPCPYKLATLALAAGGAVIVGSNGTECMSRRMTFGVLVALHAAILVAFYPSLIGYSPCPHAAATS